MSMGRWVVLLLVVVCTFSACREAGQSHPAPTRDPSTRTVRAVTGEFELPCPGGWSARHAWSESYMLSLHPHPTNGTPAIVAGAGLAGFGGSVAQPMEFLRLLDARRSRMQILTMNPGSWNGHPQATMKYREIVQGRPNQGYLLAVLGEDGWFTINVVAESRYADELRAVWNGLTLLSAQPLREPPFGSLGWMQCGQ